MRAGREEEYRTLGFGAGLGLCSTQLATPDPSDTEANTDSEDEDVDEDEDIDDIAATLPPPLTSSPSFHNRIITTTPLFNNNEDTRPKTPGRYYTRRINLSTCSPTIPTRA